MRNIVLLFLTVFFSSCSDFRTRELMPALAKPGTFAFHRQFTTFPTFPTR